MEYKIGGHTIEFSSGSSSSDPWTTAYCRKLGLSCWATSDIVSYIRIDGEDIYRIRSSNHSLDMHESIAEGIVTDFDEFMFFFSDLFEGECEKYSENVKRCDEMRRREDEWNALPQKEKDRILTEKRAELAERRKQLMEQRKGKL